MDHSMVDMGIMGNVVPTVVGHSEVLKGLLEVCMGLLKIFMGQKEIHRFIRVTWRFT